MPNFAEYPELAAREAAILRRKAIAERMMQQSQAPIDVQPSVGGIPVPIHWTQGLAKLAETWLASKMGKEAESDMSGLAKTAESQRQSEQQRIVDAMTGQPAISAPYETNPEAQGPGRPEMPGGQEAVARALLASRNPAYAKMGVEMWTRLKEPKAMEYGDVKFTGDGKPYVVGKDGSIKWLESGITPREKMTPIETTGAGGVPVTKFVNEYAPPSDALPKPVKLDTVPLGGKTDVINPYTAASTASMPHAPEPALSSEAFKQKKDIAATGASKTNITNVMGKGDSKYVEERLGARAKAMGELDKAAETAYRQIKTLDRFIEASKTGTQGGAQPVITGVQNVLSSLGFSPQSLQSVRTMQQAIGENKAAYMQQLGARGLTDKDMEVLAEALPRVATDRASREAVAEIVKKAHLATIREFETMRGAEQSAYPDLESRIVEPAWYKEYKQSPPNIDDLLKKYGD